MNKLLNNEKMILNITRYGAAILIILFTIIITIILIVDQKDILKNDIKNIEESFNSKNKIRVENLVINISNYIEVEKKLEEERLNKVLKEQVNQAYAIITSIYNKTSKDPNYSRDEILQLIKESIRNVRFNDNLGYMFMYTLDGKNILNAQFPEVEGETREPKTPSILQQQEDMKTTKQMLSLVSTQCGVGRKQNSKGNFETWIGGKLHISVVDGDIPITAIYSGANVHDSSVALPLINETSKKVSYLYDLQDAGYDSNIIRDFSKKLNHRPLIDINPKNSKELKEKIQLIKDEKKKFKILNLTQSLDTHHYNQRSMVERVNKYLKEDFGCSNIYYKGATKVASVLAFGILSVCIHQSLKLVT